MIEKDQVERLIRDYKIGTVTGYGLGLCRIAAMEMRHPILGLAAESDLPEDRELRMLQSFQEFSIRSFYNQRWVEMLLAMEVPQDEGSNTAIFVKGWQGKTGVWGYRRISWDEGPTFVTGNKKHKQFRNLLDLLHHIREDDGRFKVWIAGHPDIFAEEAHV